MACTERAIGGAGAPAKNTGRLLRLWLACQQHANRPIGADHVPLALRGRVCGWLDPATAACLLRPPSPFVFEGGWVAPSRAAPDAQEATQVLAWAAERLREGGIVRVGRPEPLDVRASGNVLIGTVERAACRALGIETRSVQLNGFGRAGALLTARRASHKLSDPDRWDNLAGGMIASGESDAQALAREAYEEAGLTLANLAVVRGSSLRVQRPVVEGLMIETAQVFDVELPDDFVPNNMDGEVSAFELRPVESALDGIERGDFTLQASLAILDSLRRGRSAISG